ncbi:MAG: hypothetical protein AUI03_09610 [Nitrospirae bacterium 13_2_20CM_2_62_8]|nr:MAG: hypothetical protein AUI03_09610 [Nitrospirae bacterium 13_2_20CM_2_62_8]
MLARRALKIYWFRASADGVLAGRAQLEAAWPLPLRMGGTGSVPGDDARVGTSQATRQQFVRVEEE